MSIDGAAVPIELNGKQYWAQPLTDLDIAELDHWARAQLISSARLSCANASQEDKELTMRIAMQEAAGLSWYSGTGLKMIATIMGMAQLLWQMLKHRHPEITPDEIRQALLKPNKLQEASEVFTRQNVAPFAKPSQGLANETTAQQPINNGQNRRRKRRRKGQSTNG